MNWIQNTQSVGFYTPFIFPEYCAANPLKQKQERGYEYILYRNYVVLDQSVSQSTQRFPIHKNHQ
jgi:hypothetical protein